MFDFDVRDVHGGGVLANDSLEGHPWEGSPREGRLAGGLGGVLGPGIDLGQAIDAIPRRPPLILAPTCTAGEALAVIGDHEQGLAMVAWHGYLLGTLTEKRLLRHLRQARAWSFPCEGPASGANVNGGRGGGRGVGVGGRFGEAEAEAEADVAGRLPVWRLMQVAPETLRETDSVGYALHKLRALDLLAMPVLDQGGALVGVLECRDLLAFFGARQGAPRSDSVGQG